MKNARVDAGNSECKNKVVFLLYEIMIVSYFSINAKKLIFLHIDIDQLG